VILRISTSGLLGSCLKWYNRDMKTLKTKVVKGIKSKTVWAITLLVAIAIIPEIQEVFPSHILNIIETALGVIAVYSKLNPSQNYSE